MKKTIDELTQQDIGKRISTEFWSGYLAQYMPRTTPGSYFGLVTTINKGELKRYAVQDILKMEVED